MKNCNIYDSIMVIGAVVFLAVAGIFSVHQARAQAACSGDDQCAAGLVCAGGRCNVRPPIWNTGGTAIVGGQDAGFDVRADSIVRGRLTVGQGDTGELLTNAIYGRSGGNNPGVAESIWIGDIADTVQVQGTFNAGAIRAAGNIILDIPGATVDGVDLDAVITQISVSGGGLIVQGSGSARTLSLAAGCADGQILKWNGAAWLCAADAVAAQEGAAEPAPPFDLCSVNLFRGFSAAPGIGAAGGYTGANSACPAGQHVCTASEILHTVNCGAAFPVGGSGWISAGPPGHTSLANDCRGWQDGTSTALGRVWTWSATGGVGTQTTCNTSLTFACCQ